jgi:cytochrome c oxidase cbb3-type subunit IV
MDFDTNLVRGLITALSLACFIGIAIWAWMPRNRSRFERDARIPLDEPPAPGRDAADEQRPKP